MINDFFVGLYYTVIILIIIGLIATCYIIKKYRNEYNIIHNKLDNNEATDIYSDIESNETTDIESDKIIIKYYFKR